MSAKFGRNAGGGEVPKRANLRNTGNLDLGARGMKWCCTGDSLFEKNAR